MKLQVRLRSLSGFHGPDLSLGLRSIRARCLLLVRSLHDNRGQISFALLFLCWPNYWVLTKVLTNVLEVILLQLLYCTITLNYFITQTSTRFFNCGEKISFLHVVEFRTASFCSSLNLKIVFNAN